MIVLNIGLAKLAPSKALEALETYGMHLVGYPCIFPSETEQTLVVGVSSLLTRRQLEALAEYLGEDAIACYDPDVPEGWLACGTERCPHWGSFDPGRFIMPNGRAASGAYRPISLKQRAFRSPVRELVG